MESPWRGYGEVVERRGGAWAPKEGPWTVVGAKEGMRKVGGGIIEGGGRTRNKVEARSVEGGVGRARPGVGTRVKRRSKALLIAALRAMKRVIRHGEEKGRCDAAVGVIGKGVMETVGLRRGH